jgi:hypothetical protein
MTAREPDEVPMGRVLAAVFASALVVAGCALWAGLELAHREDVIGRAPPVGPRPEAAPRTIYRGPIGLERAGLRARVAAARRLERFEWVDRERGVVTIPIERAIEIAATSSELAPAGGPRGGHP